MAKVQTHGSGRGFPGWENIPSDLIPSIDETYDLGEANKRWAYLFAVIAVLTSLTVGGIYLAATTEGWLFINASTYINGSLNVSENVTADYYFGSGEFLTDITGDNASWNQSLADTLYADISVTGDNFSWNESYANTLYADISDADNFSWNQSLADSLYAVLGYGDDWNKTYADTLYADISLVGDNTSWNESYANSVYLPLAGGNMTGVIDMNNNDLMDVGNTSRNDDYYDCYGDDCDAYIKFNSSVLIIKVN